MRTDDIRQYARIETEYSPQHVPAHEILLRFNNDQDAEAFSEWWAIDGRALFIEWAKDWEP